MPETTAVMDTPYCEICGESEAVVKLTEAAACRSCADAHGSPRRRTGLHISGPFNSTKFTNCCGLAVLRSDALCPGCKTPIFR